MSRTLGDELRREEHRVEAVDRAASREVANTVDRGASGGGGRQGDLTRRAEVHGLADVRGGGAGRELHRNQRTGNGGREDRRIRRAGLLHDHRDDALVVRSVVVRREVELRGTRGVLEAADDTRRNNLTERDLDARVGAELDRGGRELRLVSGEGEQVSGRDVDITGRRRGEGQVAARDREVRVLGSVETDEAVEGINRDVVLRVEVEVLASLKVDVVRARRGDAERTARRRDRTALVVDVEAKAVDGDLTRDINVKVSTVQVERRRRREDDVARGRRLKGQVRASNRHVRGRARREADEARRVEFEVARHVNVGVRASVDVQQTRRGQRDFTGGDRAQGQVVARDREVRRRRAVDADARAINRDVARRVDVHVAGARGLKGEGRARNREVRGRSRVEADAVGGIDRDRNRIGVDVRSRREDEVARGDRADREVARGRGQVGRARTVDAERTGREDVHRARDVNVEVRTRVHVKEASGGEVEFTGGDRADHEVRSRDGEVRGRSSVEADARGRVSREVRSRQNRVRTRREVQQGRGLKREVAARREIGRNRRLKADRARGVNQDVRRIGVDVASRAENEVAGRDRGEREVRARRADVRRRRTVDAEADRLATSGLNVERTDSRRHVNRGADVVRFLEGDVLRRLVVQLGTASRSRTRANPRARGVGRHEVTDREGRVTRRRDRAVGDSEHAEVHALTDTRRGRTRRKLILREGRVDGHRGVKTRDLDLRARTVGRAVGVLAVLDRADDEEAVVARELSATADLDDVADRVGRSTRRGRKREGRVRRTAHARRESDDVRGGRRREDVDRDTASLRRAVGLTVVEVDERIASDDVLRTGRDDVARDRKIARNRQIATEGDLDANRERIVVGVDGTGKTGLIEQQQVICLNRHV